MSIYKAPETRYDEACSKACPIVKGSLLEMFRR